MSLDSGGFHPGISRTLRHTWLIHGYLQAAPQKRMSQDDRKRKERKYYVNKDVVCELEEVMSTVPLYPENVWISNLQAFTHDMVIGIRSAASRRNTG
jgi:hypothetical protein